MNLLFDLDGTLTDPREGILGSLSHALRTLSIEPPPFEKLEWVIGPPLQQSIEKLVGPHDSERCAECLRLYRQRFGEVGLFENAVYPGIPETLGELAAKGHRLYVATSKPTVFSTRILSHFELAPRFIAIHGSELDGTRANKGELIAHILGQHDLRPEECVMIGDREHDIQGAKANGVRSVGVLYGYGSRDELTRAGADALVARPLDLSEMF